MEKMKLVKNGLVLDSQKGFEVNDILIAVGKLQRLVRILKFRKRTMKS